MADTKFVYRDGSRLTPWMLYCVNRASDALYEQFGERILVTSGIRTHQEQINEFTRVFRPQATGNGPYNDVRWWNGTRYVRHVGGGTVAVPGTSNHEIQPMGGGKYRGAVDLRDTGNDPGIATGNNPRANWFRANQHKWGLTPEGYSFGEPWHSAIDNIYQTPPEDDMPLSNEDINKIAAAVWNYQVNVQNEDGIVQKKKFPASGFIASTNAQVNGILNRIKKK